MVGDFPELDCRRVAAVAHGEGDFQGFTPLAIHFRRVAAKTNAIVGGGGGRPFGRRKPIGVGRQLDLSPFLHGSALDVNWTYPLFCMVRGKSNTAREFLGDFSALLSPKGTSVNSQGA